MSASRRGSVRTPVEGEHAVGTLILDQKRIPVLIVNESTGGLGVVAVNVPPIEPGTAVGFESAVRHADARVASMKYINALDAYIYRIGLEWEN